MNQGNSGGEVDAEGGIRGSAIGRTHCYNEDMSLGG